MEGRVEEEKKERRKKANWDANDHHDTQQNYLHLRGAASCHRRKGGLCK